MNKKTRGRPKYEDVLTPAEWRIVEGVRHGMTSRQIAERRNISIDAVKYHVSNILQKLDISNRTELRAWNGINRTSTINEKEIIVTEQKSIEKIGQISRNVENIDKSVTWYRDVLGLSHLYTFGDIAFFNCQGVRLFLNQTEGNIKDQSIIYFQVDDVREFHTTLSSRGVIFVNAPHMIHKHEDGTEEWMAFFNDLDGGALAIMSHHKH